MGLSQSEQSGGTSLYTAQLPISQRLSPKFLTLSLPKSSGSNLQYLFLSLSQSSAECRAENHAVKKVIADYFNSVKEV